MSTTLLTIEVRDDWLDQLRSIKAIEDTLDLGDKSIERCAAECLFDGIDHAISFEEGRIVAHEFLARLDPADVRVLKKREIARKDLCEHRDFASFRYFVRDRYDDLDDLGLGIRAFIDDDFALGVSAYFE
jgi:hypothetical protein